MQPDAEKRSVEYGKHERKSFSRLSLTWVTLKFHNFLDLILLFMTIIFDANHRDEIAAGWRQ